MLHSWHLLLGTMIAPSVAWCATLKLPDTKLHLRSGVEREWRSFPAQALGRTASLEFQGDANATEYSLILRQRDVKKTTWTVHLNGLKLGTLQDDERRMLLILPVPTGTIRTGSNTLQIAGEASGLSDDIEVTEIRFEPVPVNKLLSEATISVAAAGEDGPMPVKLTIVDAKGFLVPFSSLRPDAYEARRTGVLYTPDGIARLGVPAGEYQVFASRGFEYSAPSVRFQLQAGQAREAQLRLHREVRMPGYVSCDPHVHTRELSGHGDSTVEERVLTAAGEGLDMVVVTEHNKVEDYTPALIRRNLTQWTRSVPGNEVTTPLGHFNIFPAYAGTPQPNPREQDWSALMNAIQETQGVQVVVQNHPRDLHSNYRPFDPAHHLSSVGVNLLGRPFRANAMELVNSGAMASDPMQLVRDWLGLLTRGIPVAAIGSSDTHTVDFVPIGQARTYIDVGRATSNWRSDIADTLKSLVEGRNLVSYGLATELQITSSPGKRGNKTRVLIEVTVHGPSWSSADRVEIYSNGQLIWQDSFAPSHKGGIKYRKRRTLELPQHDTALVAVATGPGVLQPFWEVRKPYQPTSDEWKPIVMGVSRAVWVDGDGDSSRSSPLTYAERLVNENSNDMPGLIERLSAYDSSVTMHALELLRARGFVLTGPALQSAFQSAPPAVREIYKRFVSEIGRLSPVRTP